MIIGHQKQRQYLQKMTESRKLPHALLFCGQEGLGKKTVAIEFLKLSFGRDPFQHPDFIYIEPSGNEIQIAQIRDLNWKLSLRPFSAPFKAAIINKAHLMNKESQNCFLKTLEEPKGNAVLILITEYPGLLLQTIHSRVQKIKFYPVRRGEIEDYLLSQKGSREQVEFICKISMGKPGQAINLLSDSEKVEQLKSKINEIAGILDSDLGRRFLYSKELSQSEDLQGTLTIWLNYFRNLLISKLNLQKSRGAAEKEYSLEKLKTILEKIQSAIFLISTTNANRRLALDLLLVDL